MKKIIFISLILGLIIQGNAYDKKTLVERFTNCSCGPCATLNNAWYNSTTQNLVNSGFISHIIYNVNWPSANDPMYLLNSTDNMARRTFYGVTWVPWPVINSVYFDYQSLGQTQFVNTVNSGNYEYAPFKIILSQVALGSNYLEVGAKLIRDPNDVTTFNNLKLRVALTEKTVIYPSPPGSNGESVFFSVCRKMLPDANGTSFTIPAPGDSIELSLGYTPTTAFLQSVNLDSIRVVAFLQDDPSKVIYQSTMLEFLPDYVATILPIGTDVIADNMTPVQLSAVIRNEGLAEDMYYLSLDLDGPVGWSGEYTTVNGTFSLNDTDSVQVSSGDSTLIYVTINPNGVDGYGKTNVHFESKNNPGLSGSTLLRNVTTTGIDILVIDAGDRDYETFTTVSLDNVFSGTYGVVSRTALNVMGVDLSNFYAIFWSPGNSVPAFYPEEVTALETYFNAGGNLLIAGQDIGSDIFEANGQSQFAQSFYNTYLHASYVANSSNLFLVNGVAGDPITNGIYFVAGDIYERSYDKIAPFNLEATKILTYGTGTNPAIAGIRASADIYKVVYIGLGLEQIPDEADRDSIVARSIRWFEEGTTGIGDDQPVSYTFQLNQNYPNPFNPETMIQYVLDNAIPQQTKLVVYNSLGQAVRTLVNASQPAGSYQVMWDGRDDYGKQQASGIYYYQLTNGSQKAVQKMIMLR